MLEHSFEKATVENDSWSQRSWENQHSIDGSEHKTDSQDGQGPAYDRLGDYYASLEQADTAQRPKVGSIVEGVVTGIADYGAFVTLPDGQKGLIHISEITDAFVEDVRDYLSVGDQVRAEVMPYVRGKLALSIRKLGGIPRKPTSAPKLGTVYTFGEDVDFLPPTPRKPAVADLAARLRAEIEMQRQVLQLLEEYEELKRQVNSYKAALEEKDRELRQLQAEVEKAASMLVKKYAKNE